MCPISPVFDGDRTASAKILAFITIAHLMTKATKDDPTARYSWKWTITTALYEKGFSRQDIMSTYRLIDWLMMLPENLTKEFTREFNRLRGGKENDRLRGGKENAICNKC